MAEKAGTKETSEALHGVLMLALVLAKHLKDGVQVGKDIFALIEELKSNVELDGALKAAYDGIALVPSEIKDLDVMEGLTIVMAATPDLMRIAAELRA